MDFSATFMHFVQSLGFRTMLLIFAGLGLAMVLWLMFSLPGGRLVKIPVRLFLLAGIALLMIMIPLRVRVLMPTWMIRAICCTVSVTILLILLQFGRAALLVPSLALAPIWKLPLALIVSRGLSLLVVLGGMALGGMAFWNTLRVPEVRETSIPVAGLPPELEGFHIVQLTDLHLGTIFDREWCEEVVAKANSLGADLIAVTGDVGEFGPVSIAGVLEPLKALRAPQGVYYSLGNHESYQGMQDWVAFYQGAGIFLRNSTRLIYRDGAVLALTGLDDMAPDMDEAASGLPPGAVQVVLAHRPSLAPMISTYGAQLQLAGHTHGGLLPGLRDMVAQANRGFVSGLYRVGSMWLYLSNGAGLWTYVALRLDTPSEISSIKLRRADN